MQKTILVVEDDRALLGAVKLKLEKNDFQVLSARSVPEAEAVAAGKIKPDAIWLDHYLLGQETGLDFVARLKQDDILKTIPIFLVSNTSGADKVKSYLLLGINKYYTKSDFSLEEIIIDLRQAISDVG